MSLAFALQSSSFFSSSSLYLNRCMATNVVAPACSQDTEDAGDEERVEDGRRRLGEDGAEEDLFPCWRDRCRANVLSKVVSTSLLK